MGARARAQDALEYGIIDEVIPPNADKAEKAAAYWLKSGRAESDGRLEQWKEYLELQERYSMADQFKKVRRAPLRGRVVGADAVHASRAEQPRGGARSDDEPPCCAPPAPPRLPAPPQVRAQELRSSYREAAAQLRPLTSSYASDMQRLRETFPAQSLVDGGSAVQLPFTPEALKLALLHAETYADVQVKRQFDSQRVKLPDSWEAEFAKAGAPTPPPQVRTAGARLAWSCADACAPLAAAHLTRPAFLPAPAPCNNRSTTRASSRRSRRCRRSSLRSSTSTSCWRSTAADARAPLGQGGARGRPPV